MADKGQLFVHGPFETTDIRVLDSTLREVATGTKMLTTELDPGIYRVVAQVPGSSQEKLVAIEAGKPATVRNFELQWDSVTPHDKSRSHHEYQTDPAVRISRQTHANLGGDARLFVYIRTAGEPGAAVPSFRVLDDSGKTCVEFPDVGEHNLDAGWLACSLTLPAGTYQIDHETSLGRRAQAIFAENGWQTQAFVPWSSAAPDFASAVLHMRPRDEGFKPASFWEYTDTEAALNGLRDGRLVLDPRQIDIFLFGKFQDPMLGLIGAYALLMQPNIDYARLEDIAGNLLRLIPNSPDAQLFRMIAEAKGAPPAAKPNRAWPVFTAPPLFALGCERLLDFASHSSELCPADSWLGRISMSLSSGSTWTRWDPSLDASEALTKLKQGIAARFRESERAFDNFTRGFADVLSLATFTMLKPAKTVPVLSKLMKDAGPPLVRWLEENGYVNRAAIYERTAQQMAVTLAPELRLPRSVTAAALKKLLEEMAPPRPIAVGKARVARTTEALTPQIPMPVRKKADARKRPAPKHSARLAVAGKTSKRPAPSRDAAAKRQSKATRGSAKKRRGRKTAKKKV